MLSKATTSHLLLVVFWACAPAETTSNPSVDCIPLITVERFANQREECFFEAGALPTQTLGVDTTTASQLPITHVIVRMQENRSYDHLLGRLFERGQPNAEAIPNDFHNIDLEGTAVAPFHLNSTCLEADPPHQWNANHEQWNMGMLDGFIRSAAVDGSDGHYTMGYYDETDLPFLYWAAKTFAISDRYFAASLGGTWSNRNFLYTGSAHGVKNTFDRVISDARTVFDQLDEANIAWGVYVDGRLSPRQDTLGWNGETNGVYPFEQFIEKLRMGTLEPVAFVDTAPGSPNDEHPPYDVQNGDRWTRQIYEEARQSPLWSKLAIFLNYDNGGGALRSCTTPRCMCPCSDRNGFQSLWHARTVSGDLSLGEAQLRFS